MSASAARPSASAASAGSRRANDPAPTVPQRPQARPGGHPSPCPSAQRVIPPDDVAVARSDLHRRLARPGHVLAFSLERPVVAVTLAVNVQAQHFAATGYHVCPLARHGRRRTYPKVQLVRTEVLTFSAALGSPPLERRATAAKLGSLRSAERTPCERRMCQQQPRNRQLPQPFARGRVETQYQPPARWLESRIVKLCIVRADDHLPTGHHRIAIRVRPQSRHPPHASRGDHVDRRAVLCCRPRIERRRQADLIAGHVPPGIPPPLRPLAPLCHRRISEDAAATYESTYPSNRDTVHSPSPLWSDHPHQPRPWALGNLTRNPTTWKVKER